MTTDSAALEFERVRKERDLYRKLLELGEQDEPASFLRDALHLFIEVAGARRGYIELRSPDQASSFQLEHGADPRTPLMSDFSRSVVAEAYQVNETIVTASASLDPRFREKASVRAGHLEAVLCAPIGKPALGVVYLQDRLQPEPFSAQDCERAEMFARHIACFADRLLMKQAQRREHDPTARYRALLKLDAIVGSSHALCRVFERVAALAPFDQVAVLLTGPSGTGKTQLARVIHANSQRASQAFVELSCANLPDALLENELFGAAKGAHATATAPVIGKIAAAEGGTLFLDEIGELPLSSQAKLLQVLQSKTYFALGSAKPQRADVRILAATNRDLEAAIKRGEFREDLFYRLNTFPIRVPALAERPDDIAPLAHSLCQAFCARHDLPELRMSALALQELQSRSWLGNVRELASTVERAVIMARSQGLLQVEPTHLREQGQLPADAAALEEANSFGARIERYKRQLVLEALLTNDWNISQTARALGLARAHVYNLMQMLDIQRPNSNS